VAVLLTLVATIVMALPVAAENEQLNETSNVIYEVNPARGEIDVTAIVRLSARNQNWPAQTWRQLIVEVETQPSASGRFQVRARRGAPGLWESVGVRTPPIEAGESDSFRVDYTLDARTDKSPVGKSRTPARINESYMYFCVTGQDTDTGDVRVEIDNVSRWDVTSLGSSMESSNQGFRSEAGDRNDPGDIFTCFEAVRENRLLPARFIGPDERPIDLQAWSGEATWLRAAEGVAAAELRELREFIGHEMPGEGPVVIRMAPSREIGGYAGAHGTRGVVQLTESVSPNGDHTHELAHAWYGTDTFPDLWLREGMAEWTASALAGEACEAVTGNPDELELSDWLVVQPQSPDDIEQLIAKQEAAACGIVAAVRNRMPDDVWDEVVGSMLRGETKYISSAGPEVGSATSVDYREWLDAVDERGLVPAASDPAYAANLEDLDFAQDLLETFGIAETLSNGGSELALRSEARAEYHQFLQEAAPLSAPWAVRNNMDDWDFGTAMARLERAREVLAALKEADRRLPEANLIPIVQRPFEAARTEEELTAVEELVQNLLEGARGVEGPLGELQAALPPNWVMPIAVNNAISDQRFDDIMAAINPAIAAAQEITAADAALPRARYLEKYRSRYESTATAGALDDLVRDAVSDRLKAERAGRALAQLESEVGDWSIPAAVTDPLESGEVDAGVGIIEDARAVVVAVNRADEALPEAGLRDEIQPRFEAVTNAAEMAALREEVEQRATEVEAVGRALSTLDRLVPDWTIPAVVSEPIEAGRFADAVAAVESAADWVESADEAQSLLPELDALASIKADFENAQSLLELRNGASFAQTQVQAASLVREAKQKAALPRDLLTDFGLWGVDVDAIVDEALAAAVAADLQQAIDKSVDAISKIDGGSSAGSLRLAGLVFFGVAVLGVLGLWVMLRRQAGPSWARSTTPHWIEDGNKRGLLGRGRNSDDGDKKSKKGQKGQRGR
jgi:hypothetical protein